MKKMIIVPIIILLFVALTFSSGCAKKPAVETRPAGAFIGGTKGITMSFMSNAPPSEIPENSSFTIGLELKNNGEYTVNAEKAEITLSGVKPSSYGIADATLNNSGDLTGSQKLGQEVFPGATDIIQYEASKTPAVLGNQQITFLATLCYPYKTISQTTICVKESLTKQTTGGPEVCKLTGEKTVYNSGAPVQVSSVSQFPVGGRVITGLTFYLKITNAGGGTAYPAGQVTTCSKVGFSDVNKINITKAYLINLEKTLDCEGKQIILTDGAGSITCKIIGLSATDVAGEFEDILWTELDYGYKQDVTKTATIVNVPE